MTDSEKRRTYLKCAAEVLAESISKGTFVPDSGDCINQLWKQAASAYLSRCGVAEEIVATFEEMDVDEHANFEGDPFFGLATFGDLVADLLGKN